MKTLTPLDDLTTGDLCDLIDTFPEETTAWRAANPRDARRLDRLAAELDRHIEAEYL